MHIENELGQSASDFFKYNYQKVVSHKESKKSGGKKAIFCFFIWIYDMLNHN